RVKSRIQNGASATENDPMISLPLLGCSPPRWRRGLSVREIEVAEVAKAGRIDEKEVTSLGCLLIGSLQPVNILIATSRPLLKGFPTFSRFLRLPRGAVHGENGLV